MKVYTGVGSRETPENILAIMTKLARALASQGWTLRSGGAKGADSAFEAGATSKEIYYANDATPEAMEMASKVHPAWNKCNDYARKLHGRNCFQVLGKDLKTPSKFLVCWTRNAEKVGGTATAIRLAEANNIPVFNLADTKHLERIMRFVKEEK